MLSMWASVLQELSRVLLLLLLQQKVQWKVVLLLLLLLEQRLVSSCLLLLLLLLLLPPLQLAWRVVLLPVSWLLRPVWLRGRRCCCAS